MIHLFIIIPLRFLHHKAYTNVKELFPETTKVDHYPHFAASMQKVLCLAICGEAGPIIDVKKKLTHNIFGQAS